MQRERTHAYWPHQDLGRHSECCAKCRRGTKGFGMLPCGLKMACKCHDKPVVKR